MLMVERVLLWITKDTPITQEIPRVLEALCQEPGKETKYIFPIILQESQTSGMNQCDPDLYSPLANCSPNSRDTQRLLLSTPPWAPGLQRLARPPTCKSPPSTQGPCCMTLWTPPSLSLASSFKYQRNSFYKILGNTGFSCQQLKMMFKLIQNVWKHPIFW